MYVDDLGIEEIFSPGFLREAKPSNLTNEQNGVDQYPEDSGPRAVRALVQTTHCQHRFAKVAGSCLEETCAVPVFGERLYITHEYV